MVSIIIKNDGEPKVIELTYDNLYREIKDIPGAEIIVADHWGDPLNRIKNNFVCFVEADCLVNSGYFTSQLGLFKKNTHYRKLAMLASSVGVNNWANKFYGYSVGNDYTKGIVPVKDKKSKAPYPVQIAYIPGAIIRTNMLKEALSKLKLANGIEQDLVYMSTVISLHLWLQGDGNRIYINPNTSYVSTEDYINGILPIPDSSIEEQVKKLLPMFRRESI